MDLVRLSIVGGLAAAGVLTFASLARHGHAEPLPRPALLRPSKSRAVVSDRSPVLVQPGAPSPLVRLSSDPVYGSLSPFPAAPNSARAPSFDERWTRGPSAWDAYIDEASRRFGVPSAWISRVMRAESGGQRFLGGIPITSPKGAMGLMQVMPKTYAALRARYGLGIDPYDPHDNVLAGTAYLREMYDRFGASGFLAAYNAGPGRFTNFLTHGRPLPWETRRYVVDVGRSVDQAPGPRVTGVAAPVQDLTSSALALDRRSAVALSPRQPGEAPLFAGLATRGTSVPPQVDAPAGDGLFVVFTNADRRRGRTSDEASEN